MDTMHIVSFSGGKDSTAMLLRMVELDMQIDEIIFCDTGVEFPQMYDHLDRVEDYIKRPITRLRRPNSFEDMLLSHVKKNGTVGYSFPDFRNRWCTAYFKRDHIKSYLRHKADGRKIIQYVGIAADEEKRLKEAEDKRYPLAEWGWTEADALQYCYDRGFDWGACTKFFAGCLVGVVLSRVLTNSGSFGSISRNCGHNFRSGRARRGGASGATTLSMS